MERLTKETPQENFEIMMNYVFSRDGWAHICHDGERADVPLTEWAKEQCLNRDCTYMKGLTIAKEIDETLCDCLMDGDGCPVALAYCFACQASHLRDRLKAIGDILGDEYDLDRLRELAKAEKDGRLVVLPFVAMVEQSLQEGKMTPQRDQRFNGRYAVVYVDKKKWATPLIDICGKQKYDRAEAEVRLNELTRQEAKEALKKETEV